MRHMLRALILSALFLAASALAADLSGEYTGTYTSDSGTDGKIRQTLARKADSTWDCKFTFTYDGEEIETKVISCSITGNKLVSQYSAEIDGTPIQTTFEGSAADDRSFTGTYKTTGADGEVVDQGKWKASPKP